MGVGVWGFKSKEDKSPEDGRPNVWEKKSVMPDRDRGT